MLHAVEPHVLGELFIRLVDLSCKVFKLLLHIKKDLTICEGEEKVLVEVSAELQDERLNHIAMPVVVPVHS